MKRRINENTLIGIVKNGNKLAIEYIDFDKNPLFLHKEYKRLKIEYKNKNKKDKNWKYYLTWKYFRDKGFDFVEKLKREHRKYFHEEVVLRYPNSPYGEDITIGLDTLFMKIPQEESAGHFYIFNKSFTYTIGDLLDKLYLTFNNYLYKEATKKALSQKMLAVSHKVRGFYARNFEIDHELKFKVSTNFGYGRASYFYNTLFFNNVPILAYSSIVYFNYVNASKIFLCTDEYPSEHNSWEKCFNFVVKEINDFKKRGRHSFIYRHIISSLDDLKKLIGKILETNLFYLVDIKKIDSYLGLSGRAIIYDYEHYINNVNNEIINQDALNKLVNQFMARKKSEKQESTIIKSEPDEQVFKHPNIITDEKEKQRFSYAIMMLLLKNTEFNELDDDEFTKESAQIIKSILNLDKNKNFELLIYRKTGFELMKFRNERVYLALELVENIGSLKELFDATQYITAIRDSAKKLIIQNHEYLPEHEKLLTKTKSEYELILSKYKQEKKKTKSVEWQQYHFVKKYFELFKNIFDFETKKVDKGFDLNEDFDKNIEQFKKLVNSNEQIFAPIKDQLFDIDGYGSDSNSNAWSLATIRESLLTRFGKSDLNKDGTALELPSPMEIIIKEKSEGRYANIDQPLMKSLKLNKKWFEIFSLTRIIDQKTFKPRLLQHLKELKEDAKLLNEQINNFNGFADSYANFITCFLENNPWWSNLNAKISHLKEKLLELSRKCRENERMVEKLTGERSFILEHLNKLEEKLNG